MTVFHADLDNTLIFSYKHEIGPRKRVVEHYQGREVSFMTERSLRLLEKVVKQTIFVPTTTRTREQYERIDLGVGIPKYALVCNGGLLLVDGKEEEDWYRKSLRLAEESRDVLLQAIALLEKEPGRELEVRFIRDLFVFTKCREVEGVVRRLQERLDTSLVDIFYQGIKTYVVPKSLSKGRAIGRFRRYLQERRFRAAREGISDTAEPCAMMECFREQSLFLAAGDSPFDVSMFEEADLAIAPKHLEKRLALPCRTVCMPEERIYSEEVLEYVLHILKESKGT